MDDSFDAVCRQRLVIGNVVTLVGVVLVVVLGRRLGAGWTIVLSVVVLVALRGMSYVAWFLIRPHERWSDGPEVQKILDETVDMIARALGVARPIVWVSEPIGRNEASAEVLWPFAAVVVAPPSAADDIVLGDDDARDQALGVLAHEVGHHRRPWSQAARIAAARFPLAVGVCTAFTLSLRSWLVLLLATYLLVVVPGRWTMRWHERAADEAARQIGYGAALATSYDRSGVQRSWTRPLWTHPSPRESARRLRAAGSSSA